MNAGFSELTQDDLQHLDDEWTAIKALAEEEYDTDLDESMATLDVLQRMIDDQTTNWEGLRAVGIAMGRVLAHNLPGMAWWAVQDHSGRTLCLRYLDTSLRVNPITLISKRISSNDPVNVVELYQLVVMEVEKLEKEVP